MTKLSPSLLLLLLGVYISACTPPPQAQVSTPAPVSQLKYVGEIKGELGTSGLSLPVGIAFDLSNNAYIVDQGNNRVVKIQADNSFEEENGGYGLGINGLTHPVAIESDGGINFFILDQGNDRIVRSNYNLVFSDEIRFNSNPDLELAGKISDIALSRFGNMYLVDPDNLKVIMLDKDYAREQELFPAGGFAHCTLATTADDGSVYVYDRDRDTIYIFDSFGNAKSAIELPDTGILGGFIIHAGMIIATDKERHEIVIFDLDGNRLMQTGTIGTGAVNFNGPTGLALRNDNRLYVCDTGNNRIVIYELAASLP
ncbi:MAG: NHL repeat-containing protein [Candidatus Zixiibacteriota bacterium]